MVDGSRGGRVDACHGGAAVLRRHATVRAGVGVDRPVVVGCTVGVDCCCTAVVDGVDVEGVAADSGRSCCCCCCSGVAAGVVGCSGVAEVVTGGDCDNAVAGCE